MATERVPESNRATQGGARATHVRHRPRPSAAEAWPPGPRVPGTRVRPLRQPGRLGTSVPAPPGPRLRGPRDVTAHSPHPSDNVCARCRTPRLSVVAQSRHKPLPGKLGRRPPFSVGAGPGTGPTPSRPYVTPPRGLLGVVVGARPLTPDPAGCGLQFPAGPAAAPEPGALGASGGLGWWARAQRGVPLQGCLGGRR